MYRQINAFGFIGLTLTFTLLSHLDWNKITVNPQLSWTNGQQFSGIEQQYNQSFLARQFAINLWAAANFFLFNQGDSGVIVGHNNWLFTSEELNNTPSNADEVMQRLATIEQARQQIEQHGARLVVSIVPSKARVYSEYLPQALPEHANARYRFFSEWLEKNQIDHIGLLPALIPQNDLATFVKNDTHWSPKGAQLAAQFIAQQLQSNYRDFEWHSSKFNTLVEDSAPYRGDLLNYLPLEPYFSFLSPKNPNIKPFITQSLDEVGLFDDIQYPITLVGTSYSAKHEWNFVGALQQYTGVNILDMSQQGKGPFLPMTEYLQSNDFKQQPPKLIIWEIPERYLVISPNLAQEKSV
ncbi:MAG: hypothetical protein HRU23_16750 [Gammaproteobacteria bacterium]|nr:hypothetical protein [Gammaproteobacteria bacterium]